MKEVWKTLIYGDLDISEYIEVSNNGRLRNKRTRAIYSNVINQHGYASTVISIKELGVKKCIFIHRAVAYAFISNNCDYEFVNHIDLNKLNNNVNNLEWCTRSQNAIHAAKLGVYSGCNNGRSKFNKMSIDRIIELKRLGASGRTIAKQFNVSHVSINNLLNGTTYRMM